MTLAHIRVPEQVRIGPGAFEETGKTAAAYGRRALIVCDPAMTRLGQADRCRQLLAEAGVDAVSFDGIEREPTLREVEAGLALCRTEGCDVLVALGGGSCLDTAKAIAVLMTNGGSIGDYRYRPFERAPLPLVAIPTTAGTGSEATCVTVITDPETEVKMMVKRPELLPRAAIVDPLLTLSCPPSVTAGTGLDALCHAIEAMLSTEANAVTDAWAKEAIVRIAGHLGAAYEQGDRLEARENMAVASFMAGLAFSNASVTLVHGMSRPIGARFHVPHGFANAMLLPAVMADTAARAAEAVGRIAPLLVQEPLPARLEERARLTVRALETLTRRLSIPNLRGWGIDEEAFRQAVPAMAADALASGSPARHPYVPSQEQIEALYLQCYDYPI